MPNKYSASFTSGALLYDETEAILHFFQNHSNDDLNKLIQTDEFLKINSISSRKRKVAEILNRTKAVGSDYWNFYNTLKSKDEKKVFLYFVCLKKYALIRDFHLEIVLNKWRQLDTTIDKNDVLRFLKWASDKHPEIDNWTVNSLDKIAQIINLMLKETGLLVKAKLQQVYMPTEFWMFFVDKGESWFLEAMLLTKEQRENLFSKV